MSYIWVDENFKLKIPENEQSVIGSQVKSPFFFIVKLARPFLEALLAFAFLCFFLNEVFKIIKFKIAFLVLDKNFFLR